MNVPFSPPFINEDMIAEVTEVLRSGWITTGPRTAKFETELASYTGVEQVVALNSATAGLELALRWYGIGEGDEVIVASYTYCASANVVLHTGAKVVLADVGEDFNIDVQQIADLITDKTKAIIPVDFGGFPCDYEAIYAAVESKKGLFKPASEKQEQLGRILVLADSAHSLGAEYQGGKTGSCADFAAFSFHAVKNLTTAEGGALSVNLPAPFNAEEVKKELRKWSLHGQSKDALAKTKVGGWRYDVDFPGYKCNMTDIQAAIGIHQLKLYPEMLERREAIFDRYASAFSHELVPPYKTSTKRSSFHVFALRVKGFTEAQRDALIDLCAAEGVAVNVHFQPLPLLTAYKNRGYRIEDVPKAFSMYANEVSLPVFYGMENGQVDRVIDVVSQSIKAIRSEATT